MYYHYKSWLISLRYEPLPCYIGIETFGSWNELVPKAKSDKDCEQELLDAMKDGVLSSGSLHPYSH